MGCLFVYCSHLFAKKPTQRWKLRFDMPPSYINLSVPKHVGIITQLTTYISSHCDYTKLNNDYRQMSLFIDEDYFSLQVHGELIRELTWEPSQSDVKPGDPLKSLLPHPPWLPLSPMQIWQPPMPRDARDILCSSAGQPREICHYPMPTNAMKWYSQDRWKCCCSFPL